MSSVSIYSVFSPQIREIKKSIESGRITAALDQITQLGKAFKTASESSTSTLSQAKLALIATSLKNAINKETKPLDRLVSVISSFVTVMHQIQYEAALFGPFYEIMTYFTQNITDYGLDDTDKLFGPQHFFIRAEHTNPHDRAKLAMEGPSSDVPEALVAALNHRIDPAESDEVKLALFSILNECTLSRCGRVFDINIKSPHSIPILKRYLSHTNPYVKALANSTLLTHIYRTFTHNNPTVIQALPFAMTWLLFHSSLEKVAFSPLLLELFKECQDPEVGESIFFSSSCQKFLNLAGPNWREESADFFDLLLEMKSLGLTDKLRKPFFAHIRNLNFDKYDLCLSNWVNDFLKKNGKKVFLPLSEMRSLCDNRDDFRRLSFDTSFLKEVNHKPTKSTAPKRAPTRKQDSAIAGGASAGASDLPAGGAGRALDLPRTIEAGEDVYGQVESLLPSTTGFSIAELTKKLDGLTIDPRVMLWSKDTTKALELYKELWLSVEEMILRHDLPLALLPLILGPSYGRKGKWPAGAGLMHDHWDALVRVTKSDGTSSMYVIEATIDNTKRLYHYYMKSTDSIQSLMMSSHAEFPPLPGTHGSSVPLAIGSGDLFDGMEYNPANQNVTITYKGNEYTIFRIK